MTGAKLPEGVTVYQGAHEFKGEVPEGVVPQEYLAGKPSGTTVTPAPPAPHHHKTGK